MNSRTPHELQSLASADVLAGCWKLSDGRALTLRPTRPGVLRIAHGRVWVTFEQAQQDDGVRGGDHFLVAGQALELLSGQTLVMESWNAARDASAYFSWDPLPASAGMAIADGPRRILADNAPWRAGVAQPLRDLRLALGQAATASGRLAVGLAGAALAPLLPRSALARLAALAPEPRSRRASQ